LGGDVATQPGIDLVTDAKSKSASAVKAHFKRANASARRVVEHVEEAADLLVAHPDIAAQIPAAEILDRCRRRKWLRIRLGIGLRIRLRIWSGGRRDRRHISCNGRR